MTIALVEARSVAAGFGPLIAGVAVLVALQLAVLRSHRGHLVPLSLTAGGRGLRRALRRLRLALSR